MRKLKKITKTNWTEEIGMITKELMKKRKTKRVNRRRMKRKD